MSTSERAAGTSTRTRHTSDDGLAATPGREDASDGSDEFLPPRVVSASRRTDNPAHYTPWLLNRLSAGFCRYRNAFTGKWLEVDLRPEAVAALVLWTKNLGPVLPDLDSIGARYPFLCHLTVTGYPPSLEPGSPPSETAIAQARTVAARWSSAHVLWRFDPIILTPETPWAWIEPRFRVAARGFEGVTTRCYTSIACAYGKVTRRLAAAGVEWEAPPADQAAEIAVRLAEIAGEHGISVYSCCTPGLVVGSVQWARCIDPTALEAISARLTARLRRAPTRAGCGCYASVDIGAYDTCPSGCLFCYATNNPARARRAHAEHDPSAPHLEPSTQTR